MIENKKKYNKQNPDQIIEYHKKYNKQNRAKINIYERNRRKIDLNFELACNLRSKTSKGFKSQNNRKTNERFDLLGCSHSFFSVMDYSSTIW